jgi:hypothetical protein
MQNICVSHLARATRVLVMSHFYPMLDRVFDGQLEKQARTSLMLFLDDYRNPSSLAAPPCGFT